MPKLFTGMLEIPWQVVSDSYLFGAWGCFMRNTFLLLSFVTIPCIPSDGSLCVFDIARASSRRAWSRFEDLGFFWESRRWFFKKRRLGIYEKDIVDLESCKLLLFVSSNSCKYFVPSLLICSGPKLTYRFGKRYFQPGRHTLHAACCFLGRPNRCQD